MIPQVFAAILGVAAFLMTIKVFFYFMVSVVLPYVLFNLYIYVSSKIWSLVLTFLQSEGMPEIVIQTTGLTSWLCVETKIPQATGIMFSALIIRQVIVMFRR